MNKNRRKNKLSDWINDEILSFTPTLILLQDEVIFMSLLSIVKGFLNHLIIVTIETACNRLT